MSAIIEGKSRPNTGIFTIAIIHLYDMSKTVIQNILIAAQK